jgi:hypothetical protein
LRKLILEGLKENGSYVSDKAKELGNKYESLVNFYNKLVRKELENEIGYRRDESGTYIGNPAKFLKLIQTNLKAKDYPQHLIDQLKTNSDGTLQYDLSYFLDTETIENIVMSLIEKRLVRQKVNGDALVQVANSMWNGTWDVTQGNKFANLSKEELEAARKKYLGTNGLPFYTKGKDGKTLPMKVAITLQGDFFNLLNLQHLDGQPIKTIDRLNAMIKEDAWLDIADNRKSVTLTAVRIPVQGLNSMEFMEVYEFLDPSAVNMIIPPTEIVAKSGSDFDVDKLTTFFPNISKDGSYVKSSISNQNFFKEVSALENQEKNPKDIISTQKKAAENEFIETIKSILEIEENYASLVTPNDTSILEDIAIKLQDLVSTRDKYAKVNDEKPNVSKKGTKYASPTSIFEPLTNVEKHAQNLEGKRGLGIVANQNALNPLYTSIGAKMPKKYKPAEYKKKYGRYVESKKSKAVFDVRLFLQHNEIDGHISLSNIYTNDNVYKIAEIFSQALNGTVDVETNPWIFYIQGNVQALPVFLYLTEAGVSPEDAVYFISNPLIREYTENQRLKGGVFGRASGVAPELAPALKYESAKQVFDKYKERFILDRIKSLSDSTQLTIEYFRKNPVTDASEKVSEKITKGDFVNQLPTLAPNLNLVKAEGVAQVIYRNFIPSNKNAYAVSSFLSNIPGVLRRGSFDRNSMFEIIQRKGELSPEQLSKSLAMLAHYVEIENQLRGISALKNLSKPDVKNLRTPQEAIKRELDIDLAFDNSKIDLETAKGVLEESIIASFGDKDIIEKIFMPMMDLINGPKVNRFLLDALGGYEGNSKLEKIVDSKKYKATQEGLARFNRDFKSGLKTFVFQNYLSNTVFEDGKFVMIPNKYRQQEVKIDNSIDTDVTIKDGVFLINQNRIKEDYTNKRYLDTSTSAESYAERQGLEAFPSNENDLFPTEESYIRYVLERENLFQKGLRGDELNQFALINTFNPGVIINPGKYSYSDLVMKTIDKHRSTLSRQFSIIDQIRKYVEAGANKSILTLTNRDVIDGNTATLYASELKQLGNAKIQKVKNTETSPEENERLSRIFKLFPLLMIYQHGVGKTLNGFDNVLPQDDYLKIMKAAGDLFKNNYDNNKTYDFVLDKITDQNNRRFIDFTVTDSQYSQYIPKVLPAEETEVTFEDEEFQQPTQAPVSATNNPAEYTNYHGGAKKYDTYWEQEGKGVGVTKHTVYTTDSYDALDKTTKDKLEERYQSARTWLGRSNLAADTYAGKLVRRDMMQAGKADGIFAVSEIVAPGTKGRKGYVNKTNHPIIEGGTGYAVASGIMLNKPVYVFNQDSSYGYETGWYKWDSTANDFVKTDVPVLTKNYAGIGSSTNETEIGRQAIRDVYANTFKATTQPTVQPVGEVKEGVSELFESNPELAAIGTPEQYSQYLDTVFPDSKVKDILYHGTNFQFDKFDVKGLNRTKPVDVESAQIGSFFSNEKERSLKYGPNIMYTILNMTSPQEYKDYREMHSFVSKDERIDGHYFVLPDVLQGENKDSVILNDYIEQDMSPGGIDYVVFEPEQIHILGSKQDIEGFKEFVSTQPIQQATQVETIKEPGTVASKTTAQLPLSDTNIAKVLDGSKVVTTRKELIPDATYLAGNTQQVKIKYLGIARVVGNSVVITNEKTKKSFVRTRDQFAKAEGFKNWSDYTDNNRFIQGFIKGDNTRYVYEISPAGRIQELTTGQQRINPENNPVIGLFNEELARTNGVYPKEFIYESSEGTNKYVLSENNLYNLVDIDTGSIYLRNIDLTTGNIVSDPLPQTPVGKDSITKFIDTLNSQIKEYRIDIVLANKGIDVNEIIDRAENVNSEEELNELRILINKNLC